MKNINVKKLALAGILIAVGIVCSPLSIPVGASKCAPMQHFINILGGVFLGPGYAVGMAFYYKSDPQPDGNRYTAGLPGFDVRCAAVRSAL